MPDDTARTGPHPRLWATAAALLLVPLVAMQFTREVAWDAADFAVFAAMLATAAGACELAAATIRTPRYRRAAGLAIVAAFVLVWLELAVGLFA